MTNPDILTIEDIEFARTDTHKRSRKTVISAILLGIAGGLVALGFVVLLRGVEDLVTGFVAAAAFSLIGFFNAFRWNKHYRSILSQLDVLEARVAKGELLRGAEVQFR